MAGSNRIRFSKGTAIIKGVMRVPIPLNTIAFYIIFINIPFLLYLQDIDTMGVQFNNFKNILI